VAGRGVAAGLVRGGWGGATGEGGGRVALIDGAEEEGAAAGNDDAAPVGGGSDACAPGTPDADRAAIGTEGTGTGPTAAELGRDGGLPIRLATRAPPTPITAMATTPATIHATVLAPDGRVGGAPSPTPPFVLAPADMAGAKPPDPEKEPTLPDLAPTGAAAGG
jgi:hypothetical protein